MDLTRFPKVNVVSRPTPIDELVRLRKAIDCKPRIFVKRDDTTIAGLGGNKNRKLQYVMADAREQDADVVITTGGVQSNHCRQTLALARLLGMDCHLILTGEEPTIRQGNCLIFTIMGAKLHFIGAEGDAEEEMRTIAEELRASGKRPYIIPLGASTPLGSLGYVEAMMEITTQAEALGVAFRYCFIPTGSCGTQAGIEVGVRELYPKMQVHGISVNRDAQSHQETLAELVSGIYDLLGMSRVVKPPEFVIHDQYYGEGYAIPTKEGNEMIKMLATTEGLILDPVYTGKAMSGLVDLLRLGALDDAEAVLFLHTGGFPALFAMAEQFQ